MSSPSTGKAKLALPANIKKLFLRAVLVFAGWCLLYQLVLKPMGIPDNQLTQLVLKGTVTMLSWFHPNVYQSGSSVFLNGVKSVNVAPQCNGLELIALYIGMMLIMPSNWKRMIVFSIAGISVIILLNMVRCSLLAYLYLHHMAIAEFAHHYAFKMVIYAVAFYGWVLYSKKINFNAL